MDATRLQMALVPPASREAAEEWVGHVVRALGPRFRADDGVGGYWLSDEVRGRLEVALARARELLGERLDDLTYRHASRFLRDLDLEYAVWARPLSKPPPRLWMIERPDSNLGPHCPDPLVGLAFEDERGRWWMWEPTRNSFHSVTPGLATDFYYRAAAQTDEWIDKGLGRFRFTRLSIEEAGALLDAERFGGAGEAVLRHLERGPKLEFAQVAEQIRRSNAD